MMNITYAKAGAPLSLKESTPRSKSLSIVIPAYNEQGRLPDTLRRIDAFLRSSDYDAEILVVNDGSIDGTREAIRSLLESIPTLRVISFERNHGKGFAVKSGMLAASREAVLFSDADLSTPIEEIDRLWNFYDRGIDVTIASRHLAHSKILLRQPVHRRILGRVFNLIISLLGVRGIRDTQCGFKLFRKKAAKELFCGLKTQGFAFDVEVLINAKRLGMRIAEVPVNWIDSPQSRVRPIVDSARMLLEILKMRGLI